MTQPQKAVRLRLWILFIAIGSLVLGLDLWTKEAVFEALKVENVGDPPRVLTQEKLVVIPRFFEFEANYNYGAFHGWFSDHTEVLTVVSAVALVVIVGILAYVVRQGVQPLFVIALSLIAGGTAGNLYDRAVLSAVRDWIKWFYVWDGKEVVWPNFNIADSGICVGVGLILFLEIRSWSRARGEQKETAANKQAK